MKYMPHVIVTCLILLITLFGLVRYLEAKGVFFPSRTMTMDPSFFHLAWQDVWVTSTNKARINGWLIKNPQAKSVMLFCHGNAGNISDRLMKLKFFHELGFEVLIFDYQGYGKSEGVPSEGGIYQDAISMFDWIKQQEALKNKSVVVYGTSLGGIVAIDLATKRGVDGLIVDSSITSAKDMAKRLYPMIPSFLMAIKFDSISKIKNLTMPKLFIHSREDRVVPYAMGQALFNAAPEPKEFLTIHGGHNDSQIASDPVSANAMMTFLQKHHL